MIGLRVLITASALAPRRAHISGASRFRIRMTAALLGLISSLRLRYSLTWKPKKQKPSRRWTTRVLSSLKASGRQPGGEPLLDLFGLFAAVAHRHQIVCVPDQHGAAPHRAAGVVSG